MAGGQKRRGCLAPALIVCAVLAGPVALLYRSHALNEHGRAARFAATDDFLYGEKRILELSAEPAARRTDRVQDGLPVWLWPKQGADVKVERVFVDAYNAQMRYLNAHPDRAADEMARLEKEE